MELFADTAGERLDAFVARSVPELTRSAAQKLIEEGCVLRGDKPGRKNDKLNIGECIRISMPEPKAVDVVPTEMHLDIAYEDDDIIVINKPKGLVVHPAAGHQDDTLVNGLLYALGDSLSGINGELRPGIVHRIDKDTSGLLAVAKNDFAHTFLASQLKDHSMHRVYDAIVCGTFRETSGTVDAPIGRHPSDRKKMCVTQRNSREAVTHWEVVRTYRGYTHIRCRLQTGRTHQIRVHMAHIGHPILGDTVYGRKKAELGQDSQCLHAGTLCFSHPRDGRPVMVLAPLPEYFEQVLQKLEKCSENAVRRSPMADFSDILLTVDYDRTLTGPDATIPQRNLDAIRWFIDNGGAFTVNTGRSLPMARPFLDKVPVSAPLLLYNGSGAYDTATGTFTQIYPLELDPDAFVSHLEQLFPYLLVEIQGTDAHYTGRKDAHWEQFSDAGGCAWGYARPSRIPGPFLKVSLYGSCAGHTTASMYEGTAEELQQVKDAIDTVRALYGDRLEVFHSTPKIVDIHAKGVSKLRCARELQRKMGKRFLVCVGDSDNDVSMLAGADFAYCPSDSKVADRFETVCACGDGSVADVIFTKIPEILKNNP